MDYAYRIKALEEKENHLEIELEKVESEKKRMVNLERREDVSRWNLEDGELTKEEAKLDTNMCLKTK